MNFDALNARLTAIGQQHVLRYWNDLDDAGKQQLSAQLEKIDLESLPALVDAYVLNRPKTEIPADLEPAQYFPKTPRDDAQKALYDRAKAHGEALFRAGKIAALTVAGGQGTRLGFDGPKGTYPIGPVSGKSLFAYFAETLLFAGKKYGKPITWYIMTSLLNHSATVAFFRENNFFGLAEDQVFFFSQGTMPAFGTDGKLLLGARDSLSLSPDGHGGTLLALRRSGAIDRMQKEGTEILSYFQVDNPLAPAIHPLFAGLHDLEGSEMSAIMLAKTGPFEKLGNFCVSGGRTSIIEYSDLPADLAESRNPDGSLRFLCGSPAIHLLNRAFVERLTEGGKLQLPWHRADKKVPYLDENGTLIQPEEPNAVKLESFIFDAMPLAERTMLLEGDRETMFAPTKNKTGVDSAESCRAMILARDAQRLADAGFVLPQGARIELSPLAGMEKEDLLAYFREHAPEGAW
ncbi:MAG: UTP--glucose-1-phosphate uridylyltransferase [Lentisphaeria bacterium]|nr:UTP--glucose-1-phosphate uridylyltransferase [Lentisphaeria bacterium]